MISDSISSSKAAYYPNFLFELENGTIVAPSLTVVAAGTGCGGFRKNCWIESSLTVNSGDEIR
jgi:hypothetical protein